MNCAVLFLIFNRPETTQQVFESIRAARPPRLYVAADGPRSGREGEVERCNEVRRIATNIDWPCDVKTLFRDSNLGCRLAVSSGIDWFFEQEEEGIILEDDCLPDPTFYRFCQDLLQKYRNDPRVAMVAGTNFNNSLTPSSEHSYFFSNLVQIWGWATWRRAWQLYDCDMKQWKDFYERDGLKQLGINKSIIDYVTPSFKRLANNEIDTWDYQWSFCVLSNAMYTAVPNVNLIKNMGFGNDATHSQDCGSPLSQLKLNQMKFPLVHPDSVTPDLNYDLHKIKLSTRSLSEKVMGKLTSGTTGVTSTLKRSHNIFRNIKYLTSQRPYPIEKPIVLQFPVTDICNSACQMCRIWENKSSDDISPDKLRKGLSNSLFSEVVSVGLNGGEPTLRKDLPEIVTVLFEKLPKLQFIALITNGYDYENVTKAIREIGEIVRVNNAYLNVMVSLDGYGEMHDRIRGKSGIFESAQKVIDFAVASPLVQNVQIGYTIIKDNVFGLADLFEYCQQRGLYIKYRLGIPHQRLYTQDLIDPYALTIEEKYHIVEFLEGLITHYEPNENQKFFYRSLIDQLVYNSPRKAGCDWQHRGATITSKGELLYCAVHSKVLGYFTDEDSQKLYFDNTPHLREIITTKCDACYHDYVGLPPKKDLVKQLATKSLQKLRMNHLAATIKNSIPRKWLHRHQFNRRLESFKNIADTAYPISLSVTNTKTKRILICGWYGTETLGDKAILGGVVYALRHVLNDMELTLVSLYPYVSEITCRQMPELKDAKIVTPAEGIRLVAGMDLVVFGGGPLMALISQIAEMEALFSTATRNKIPTLIAGCGVGPLGNIWFNESIKRILAQSSLRIYRDTKSRDLAASLGIPVTEDIVAEDPAFTWLHNQKKVLSAKTSSTLKVLLLGLRDFPYAEYASHLSKEKSLAAKERFERELVLALEELVVLHPDLIIRPLPMCTNHFGNDDRWFYRRLFRGNEALSKRLDLSLLGPELTPLEYSEAFRGATVALTMRFHSLVFALGLEVPAVAIDYTLGKGKVHSLAERFGVPYQSLVNIDSQFIVHEVSRLLLGPVPQAVGFNPRFCEELVAGLSRLKLTDNLE